MGPDSLNGKIWSMIPVGRGQMYIRRVDGGGGVVSLSHRSHGGGGAGIKFVKTKRPSINDGLVLRWGE